MHDHVHHRTGTGHVKPLIWSLLLTLSFALVEAVAGWWSGSLALLGDAGHMTTDSLSLGLGVVAGFLARRPAGARYSYGWGRAEVLAALANALFMLAIIAAIALAAIARLQAPRPVAGGAVIGVAALGLLVNLLVFRVLHRGEQTLNIRGALLHVLGDLLGSAAALTAGLVIVLTGWTPIDPILSLLICALILVSALRLLREALRVVMEGVPANVNLPAVGQAMAGVDGVLSVHDLHIWQLDSSTVSLSAHVVINDLTGWPGVLDGLRDVLIQRFGISHITLQPEPQVLAKIAVSQVQPPPAK